jgi:hypothetical protein
MAHLYHLGCAVLIILAVLSGCAEHWAKPGGTEAELQRTKAECETQSYARFPPVLQQVMMSPGYFAPPETRCHTRDGQTRCHTVGGFWVPPSFQTVDLNQDGRNSARNACMYAHGWMLAEDAKEAAAITASGIPSVPPPVQQVPVRPR